MWIYLWLGLGLDMSIFRSLRVEFFKLTWKAPYLRVFLVLLAFLHDMGTTFWTLTSGKISIWGGGWEGESNGINVLV